MFSIQGYTSILTAVKEYVKNMSIKCQEQHHVT